MGGGGGVYESELDKGLCATETEWHPFSTHSELLNFGSMQISE